MADVEGVFISHTHFDHVAEVGIFLYQNWIHQRLFPNYEPLKFFGPGDGVMESLVDQAIAVYQSDIDGRGGAQPQFNVQTFPTPEGTSGLDVLDVYESGDGVTVSAVFVGHRTGPDTDDVSYKVVVEGVGSVIVSGDVDDSDFSTEQMLKFEAADVLVHEVQSINSGLPNPGGRVHASEVETAQRSNELLPTDGSGLLMLTHFIPSPCYPYVGPFQAPSQRSAAYLLDDDFVYELEQGGYLGDVVVADDLSSVTLPGMEKVVTCGSKAFCAPIPDDYEAKRPSGRKYRYCNSEDVQI